MKKFISLAATGIFILIGVFPRMICVNAVTPDAGEYCQEEIGLLQEGCLEIPEYLYSFDKESLETIPAYLSSAPDTTTTAGLLEKQQAAAVARADGNATLQDRKAECAKALYIGMTALEKQIEVAEFALTRSEFKEVISDVVNSNPELFYIRNGYKVKTFVLSDTDSTEIVDYCCGFYEYQDEVENSDAQKEYIPQRGKIRELVAEVEDKRDRILSDILVEEMNNMEKALMIHEYLILNTEYDNAACIKYEQDSGNKIPDADFDIYGTLINGQAVCQGYTLAYKYLLEAAGVENVGFASNTSHVWNTVTLDGDSYYVDCTWDDPCWDTLGNVKHKYFLKGQDAFLDHLIVDTDRVCQGTAYNDMFWDDVNSGIFYCKGVYYYIGNDGNLYKARLRTSSDIAEGSVKVTDLELTGTNSWNYDNGAKLAIADNYAVYHDSKNIYAVHLKTGEKLTLYTPELPENELIYGILYQNGNFYYATRNQKVTGGSVSYENSEQNINSYMLPEKLFYIPVEKITISGGRTIVLSMVNGSMVSGKTDLNVIVSPENATDKRIQKWTSSDSSVAVVDINGRVKGVSPGEVTITALSYDGVAGSYTVKVIVEETITDNGDVPYDDQEKPPADGFYQIDGKTYYFGKDGRKVTGWQRVNGKRYYLNEDGILTGRQTIGGKQYYFNNEGIMLTGWQTIGSKRYYFNEEGAMSTGWKTIKKKRYYFNKKGVMSTGWQTIKKKRYYFNKKGVMSTGWKTIKKKRYYFNKKGVMSTGWKTIKKKRYYFNKKGVMLTGWKTIKNKKYYFDKKGVLRKR